MKIKDLFVLQELVDEYMVVPVGNEADRMQGIIRLNETGAFLWKLLSEKDRTEDDLVKAITDEYDTDKETAKKDVTAFIDTIKQFGCLE